MWEIGKENIIVINKRVVVVKKRLMFVVRCLIVIELDAQTASMPAISRESSYQETKRLLQHTQTTNWPFYIG